MIFLSIKVFQGFHQISLLWRILLLVCYCCFVFTYLKLLLDNAFPSWYAYTGYCLYVAYTCSHLYLIDAFTSPVVVSTSWYTYTWYTYTSRFDYPTLYAYTSRLGFSTVRLYFTTQIFHCTLILHDSDIPLHAYTSQVGYSTLYTYTSLYDTTWYTLKRS